MINVKDYGAKWYWCYTKSFNWKRVLNDKFSYSLAIALQKTIEDVDKFTNKK